ncbi:MAG: hypothetical protein KIT43_06555 [Bauldia sp.]|nr:hypothetical protein [Bauldia sp.]MCW5717281.1 hypothetical protein [Bauldia sp.]
MARIRIGTKSIPLPANRVARTAMGAGLVAGGTVGFLPVVGFWMVPVGLMVLSTDSAVIRRFNRRATVRVVRWWRGRGQSAAETDQ